MLTYQSNKLTDDERINWTAETFVILFTTALLLMKFPFLHTYSSEAGIAQSL